ncbi:molybdenum ABC transporter, periplasmic molybdate-binding protein [Desulfarculus baarsii DSM 2075]|uniref:Molybdenum ABC transporter, periplasmic molybdate-binding protein n=1 Tax=Desulfarculus baarsii (strain ATCC 33931 / DSM 2075 / LMG 7858 / VKM B-1802 / 2st14) TaxID=644282 RepID=E1QG27_DESB2|nr:molybdenum ABC transporter, periplasmic molybdate-binding protein [Desulfarculus baarsii DSM 2075]
MLRAKVAALIAGLTLLLAAGPGAAQQLETVTVFAAASTTNAMTDIANAYEAAGKAKVVCSFASSSTLAKQIANGAPVHVFLSANPAWMNYLAQKKLLAEGSRIDLLGNQLVLIAPVASTIQGEVKPGFPLTEWLAGGRLAMGDPDHVPVGIYAREALTNLGVWPQLGPDNLALAANVRAALALVERDEAPLGVVYATDAAISDKVRVVAAFPADSHKPVVYPVALIAGRDTVAAKGFAEFLRSEAAAEVFKKYGFVVK